MCIGFWAQCKKEAEGEEEEADDGLIRRTQLYIELIILYTQSSLNFVFRIIYETQWDNNTWEWALKREKEEKGKEKTQT